MLEASFLANRDRSRGESSIKLKISKPNDPYLMHNWTKELRWTVSSSFKLFCHMEADSRSPWTNDGWTRPVFYIGIRGSKAWSFDSTIGQLYRYSESVIEQLHGFLNSTGKLKLITDAFKAHFLKDLIEMSSEFQDCKEIATASFSISRWRIS